MTLCFPRSIYDALVEHAESGTPREIVGVLAGSRCGSRSKVTRAYRARNVAEDRTAQYEIAPEEEIDLLKQIDSAGLECVGFYHSHPSGPPEPSETDARLAAWKGYSYAIVLLGPGTVDFGSWRWDGDRFEREDVRIG